MKRKIDDTTLENSISCRYLPELTSPSLLALDDILTYRLHRPRFFLTSGALLYKFPCGAPLPTRLRSARPIGGEIDIPPKRHYPATSSSSGSSWIVSFTPPLPARASASAAALALRLRLADSLSFSHRSRKRAIVNRYSGGGGGQRDCIILGKGRGWGACKLRTFFSFSIRLKRISSSSSRIRAT